MYLSFYGYSTFSYIQGSESKYRGVIINKLTHELPPAGLSFVFVLPIPELEASSGSGTGDKLHFTGLGSQKTGDNDEPSFYVVHIMTQYHLAL
jgi:hypothetical protein